MLEIVQENILRIDTQNAGPRFVEITDDMRLSARRISQHRIGEASLNRLKSQDRQETPEQVEAATRLQSRTDEVIAEDKHNLRNLLRTRLNSRVFQPDYDSADLIDDFELDEFVNSFVDLLHPGTFVELT